MLLSTRILSSPNLSNIAILMSRSSSCKMSIKWKTLPPRLWSCYAWTFPLNTSARIRNLLRPAPLDCAPTWQGRSTLYSLDSAYSYQQYYINTHPYQYTYLRKCCLPFLEKTIFLDRSSLILSPCLFPNNIFSTLWRKCKNIFMMTIDKSHQNNF